MKYKIGDRVKVVKEKDRDDLIGKVGTIVDYNCDDYSVEFDEKIKYGNTCYGDGKKEHCWFFDEDQIELVEETQEPNELNKVLQKLSNKISELADSSEEVLELLKDITNKN